MGKRNIRIIEPFEEMYLTGLSLGTIARLLKTGKHIVASKLHSIGIVKDRVTAQMVSYEKGRVTRKLSTHPSSYRARARILMEKHLGRKLTKDENVHHKDGDYTNNVLENLEILTHAEHLSLHKRGPNYDTPKRIAARKASQRFKERQRHFEKRLSRSHNND